MPAAGRAWPVAWPIVALLLQSFAAQAAVLIEWRRMRAGHRPYAARCR
ncbi:hypothetical protein BSIN_5098 [Burkholderia singularis]|uniref:Uncharacterized protein n=1 Tax=Burkholderia singularis TaxID=1503053 RepID=A0A238HB96_9BURK|nr:hypothetical protein BSIN_5098 [Burkholderia singularis]